MIRSAIRPVLSGLISIICVVMVFVYLSEISTAPDTSLPTPFSWTADPGHKLTITDASAILSSTPASLTLRNHLEEYPFWIQFNPDRDHAGPYETLEFSSRHIQHMDCWVMEGQRAQPVGSVRHGVSQQFDYQKSAWTMGLANHQAQSSYLCKIQFVGPAQLALRLWDTSKLNAARGLFKQRTGFLEGGLTLLMGLVAIASLLSRSKVFLIYCIWLITSLRVAALSGGWDNTWYNWEIDPIWIFPLRTMALAGYYIVSTYLIENLFFNTQRTSVRPLWMVIKAAGFVLLLVAIIAPYKVFLMVLWPTTLISSVVVTCIVIQSVIEKRDTVSLFYLLGIVITLCGAVSEVLHAWLDVQILWNYFNSSSVTLIASLMTGISVAESLRNEQHQKHLVARHLRISNDRLRSIFTIAPSAMFTSSAQGVLINYNKQFEEGFLQRGLMPGYDFLTPANLSEQFSRLGCDGEIQRLEYNVPGDAGQSRWIELVISRDEQELVGVVADITIQKDREAALHHQVTHDELTGALNKRGLESRLAALASQSTHQESELLEPCVFYTDIKRFRYIARAYGPPVADHFLQIFYAELFRYMCVYGDIARLQGDQFVMVVQPNQLFDAKRSFIRFIDRIHGQPFLVGQRQIYIEVTSGIIQLPMLTNLSETMDILELSLRESRLNTQHSPSRYPCEFSAEQTRYFIEQAKILSCLRANQLPDNLTLVWQPILSLRVPQDYLYAEVLLRCKDPEGKIKSAGHIIDACLSHGHSTLLDSWVLNQTLSWLSAHIDELQHLKAISINISPSSLNDDLFISDTIHLMLAHAPVINKVCFEITEVGTVINQQAVDLFIQRVRSMGVRICLDDFGAGYSNFRYAIDLHTDVIKIDGSIIKDICRDPQSMAVAKSIINLSHDLGCQCVAEWVEDTFTLAALKALEVDYIQGFIVSQALEPHAFLGQRNVMNIISDSAQDTIHEVLSQYPDDELSYEKQS